MRHVRVKVCGNTRICDIELAAAAGADAVGFIVGFPTSPRNLTLDQAYELMKHTPPFVDRVVVARGDPTLLGKIAEMLPINGLQIIGEAPHSKLREALRSVTLIKVIHSGSNMVEEALEAARKYDAVLVDSAVEGKAGGTGRTHDWAVTRLAVEAVRPKPLILAGGLTPENVEEAVKAVKPYGVDVSSGVESEPGLKDPAKVERFVERAKMVVL